MRDGQASFVGAVADQDLAARRAEAGIAELRFATEEAVDLLAGRIEKARELSTRLEKLTTDASRLAARPAPDTHRPAPGARPPRHARPAPMNAVVLDRAVLGGERLSILATGRATSRLGSPGGLVQRPELAYPEYAAGAERPADAAFAGR